MSVNIANGSASQLQLALVANDPKAAAYNQSIIQQGLSSGGVVSINDPGTYHLAGDSFSYSNGAAVLLGQGVKFSVAGVIRPLRSIAPIVSGPKTYARTPQHRALREFYTTQDVTNAATGGTTTVTIDTAAPMGGTAMKLAFGVGVTQHDVTISGLSLPNFTAGTAKIVVVMYFDDARAVSQLQGFYGTTTGFSPSLQATYGIANNNLYNQSKTHIFSIHPDAASVTNTLATTDTVTAVRLRFQRSASASSGNMIIGAGAAPSATATNCWIKGIYVVEKRPPFVCLTFDDASASWMQYVHPALSQRGLNALFAVNKSDVGTNNSLFVTTAQLQQMHDYGHDLSSHNLTNTAFTPATITNYLDEFRQCRDWMYANGWTRRLDYHSWVQGVHNPDICDALQNEGVRYARAVNSSMNFEQAFFQPGYLMMTSSVQFGNGITLAQAQARVTQAITRGQDLVCMGHVIAPTSSDSVTWSDSNWTGFLDYCISLRNSGAIGGIGSLSDYLAYIGGFQTAPTSVANLNLSY